MQDLRVLGKYSNSDVEYFYYYGPFSKNTIGKFTQKYYMHFNAEEKNEKLAKKQQTLSTYMFQKRKQKVGPRGLVPRLGAEVTRFRNRSWKTRHCFYDTLPW